jgi:hypothetical protein
MLPSARGVNPTDQRWVETALALLDTCRAHGITLRLRPTNIMASPCVDPNLHAELQANYHEVRAAMKAATAAQATIRLASRGSGAKAERRMTFDGGNSKKTSRGAANVS